ncbi:MAG: alanine--tRNA ligase-related protein, partial [bacterium]|nr:alanine--tRNA ligase-related protein [bacterium]
NNIYETELFQELMDRVAKESKEYQSISARIVADHARASVFIAADGVIPSNKEQGYVLRKLIRKTVREFRKLGLDDTMLEQLLRLIIHQYQEVYPHVAESSDSIVKTITEEAGKFRKTLAKGEKFLAKELSSIKEKPQEAGKFAFDLYQTYGFPPEMSFEILTKEEGLSIEDYVFDGLYQDYLKRHQEMSRAGSKEKFAGGLADHSERVVRMHTATHLLHQALRDVLGDHVYQKGSNITAERLRFDFTHPRPVTDDELRRVEVCVNEKVQAAMEVTKKFLPLEEARKLGAIGLFGEKYGDTVSVYLMGDYSKEFCGGPHVNNTKEVGIFSITKEEAVSAGVRRIKAMVV